MGCGSGGWSSWEARAHVSGSVPPNSKVGHVRKWTKNWVSGYFSNFFSQDIVLCFLFQNAVVLRAPALQGESSLCVWIEMRRIFFFENLKSQNWVLWINQSCKQLSPRQEQHAHGCYRSCSSQTHWEAFLRMPMAKQHYDTFSRPKILGNTKLMDLFFQSSWELGSLVFRTWTSHQLMQHFRFKESIGRKHIAQSS